MKDEEIDKLIEDSFQAGQRNERLRQEAVKEKAYKAGYEQRQGEVLEALEGVVNDEVMASLTEYNKAPKSMKEFYRGYKNGAKNLYYSLKYKIKNQTK